MNAISIVHNSFYSLLNGKYSPYKFLQPFMFVIKTSDIYSLPVHFATYVNIKQHCGYMKKRNENKCEAD